MWHSAVSRALAVVLVAQPLATQGDDEVRRRWMNTTLGLGGASATFGGEVQGSPQAFARLGTALSRGRRWGIEVVITTRGVLLPRIYGQRAWVFVIGPGLR